MLARRTGATLACAADAERLLRAGELVGTWPEGYRGIGKRFRDRYQVQRFGRAGFVASAAATGVPIVPVSIVGGEEIHPVLGNARDPGPAAQPAVLPADADVPLARPARPRPAAEQVVPRVRHADQHRRTATRTTRRAVTELADLVRDSIQATLYRLLVQRRSVWR